MCGCLFRCFSPLRGRPHPTGPNRLVLIIISVCWRRDRKSGKGRSRDRSRDRGDRKREEVRDRKRETSAERRAKIAEWNKSKDEPAAE